MNTLILKATICIFLCVGALISWSQDLFPVRVDGQYGYIDKGGTMKISPQFQNAFDFHEGLAKVKINKHIGYINISGKVVVESKYKRGSEFSEGLAAVRNAEGKWSYIDTKGNTKFNLDCSFAYPMRGIVIGLHYPSSLAVCSVES